VSFAVGDIVRLKGMGSALWHIDLLGEQTFLTSGEPLSEDSSQVSFYLPDARVPLSAYPITTWTQREFMVPVPAMLVIALEAAWKPRSNTKELLLEQSYKRRLKCSSFRKANPDLVLRQERLKAEWSNLPARGR
jgi:hypothetical protein